jgi:hypothetical protein
MSPPEACEIVVVPTFSAVSTQAAAFLQHLSFGSALGSRFLLRGVAALILHLAAVEPHVRIVADDRWGQSADRVTQAYCPARYDASAIGDIGRYRLSV